jgi:uncharacterized protein (DUF58 family)
MAIRWLGRTTASGFLFAGVLAAAGAAAVLSGNNLVFLVLAGLLAVLMVSNLVSRLSLAGLELELRLPEHVSARRAFPAKVVVRNAKRWMPSFSVRLSAAGTSAFTSALYFPVLPGGATVEETVELSFARRGVHREDNFCFSTAFPFGFLQRQAQVSLRREVLVYPCLDPQPGFDQLMGDIGAEVDAHYRGRGQDFYRIRPYEAMESARHVDWKASAHTGTLQVREFVREEEPLVEVIFDLYAPETLREWFEQAVDCCAYVVWRLSAREARVRFLSQDLTVTIPATGDVHRVLKYLALVEPRPSAGVQFPTEDNSYALVFTAEPKRFEGPEWDRVHFVTPATLGSTRQP